MKCFNHHQSDAIGICKNCSKGLCKECLTEVKNGIACTLTCVEEVNQVNSLIDRNKKSYGATSGAHLRNAYIYGSMGIIFIIFGYKTEGMGGFLFTMGTLFLVASVLSIISAKKYKK